MTENSYREAFARGELAARRDMALARLQECALCPRNCRVNRLANERGFCRTGRFAEVASYGPHFGEESVLVGSHGSGTIFFAGCNLRCVFCQNHDISQPQPGANPVATDEQLAAIMLELQAQGCHNINLVTPSHVVPQLLSALVLATAEGLTVPLVYNSGGYDDVGTLALLAGIVDIYMPDFKFWSREKSARYLRAADYPERAKAAVLAMQEQVGDLVVAENGLARHGLLVRHLLMPGGEADTEAILNWLSQEISAQCYLNIMDQYRPCGDAGAYPELLSTITAEQQAEAMAKARAFGLMRLDERDLAGLLRRLFD